ncbi:hypothetical protein HDV05_006589, partial [Chytridiales sp. JEL 0842]
MPQTVLITGASAGIGKNLAHTYANHYATKLNEPLTLALTARRIEKLEEIKKDLEGRFPGRVKVEIAQLDVNDSNAVFSTIDLLSKKVGGQLNVIIANAGVMDGQGKLGDPETFKAHAS